jgi:hypothetical protein
VPQDPYDEFSEQNEDQDRSLVDSPFWKKDKKEVFEID